MHNLTCAHWSRKYSLLLRFWKYAYLFYLCIYPIYICFVFQNCHVFFFETTHSGFMTYNIYVFFDYVVFCGGMYSAQKLLKKPLLNNFLWVFYGLFHPKQNLSIDTMKSLGQLTYIGMNHMRLHFLHGGKSPFFTYITHFYTVLETSRVTPFG